MPGLDVYFLGGLIGLAIILFYKMIRIVPEQQAWIVEQLGKYKKSLGAGLHFVVPVYQKIAYKHTLKEEVVDVAPQVCITKDNVQVTVDGILYLKVLDPEKASYGIDNYKYATAQLAQTTMRSEIGKIDLDRSFSERDAINYAIVKAVDEASDPWGIKVTRYEIKDISMPRTVVDAMEQQMRAERVKRADILKSEGEKTARINVSKGEREEAINLSKGERQKRINMSEGKAKSIELSSEAMAGGIKLVADALQKPKGKTAMSLRIAEQFINQFGSIIETANTSILPLEVAQIKSILSSVMEKGKTETQVQKTEKKGGK
jgi:regulator of protease activity HflC (stomatin/prohibitin superfamily)